MPIQASRAFFVAFVVAIAAIALPGAAPADSWDVNEGIVRGNELLDAWRIDEAEAVRARLDAAGAGLGAELLGARIAFLRGDYEASLAAFARAEALAAAPFPDSVRQFRDFVARVAANMRGFEERDGEHFRVRFQPGPDEVLVEPILRTLESARERIGEDLGYVPTEKVLVEILPTKATFVDASTLSAEAVETSGTIAVCKFRRLMMMSPRLALRGFPYLDKISHEYVHYVITSKTRNRTPVWLHEGIAFYEETRWRSERGGYLQPMLQALLADATARGRWISIEAMSPSIALLPSQDDAALAFAQVIMGIDWVIERSGYGALRGILDRIAAGASDRGAFEAVLGEKFGDFETEWRAHIAAQSFTADRKLRLLTFRIADHEPTDGDDAELREIRDTHARDFTRLGDLLRERGRAQAAATEYGKASEAAEALTPVIEIKLARSLLAAGEGR
ncbi:MAG: hypothetical protein KC466_01200, partial [Myxococcales bacterium]|nr:hypothetical protein [Myxococcales bacterium]